MHLLNITELSKQGLIVGFMLLCIFKIRTISFHLKSFLLSLKLGTKARKLTFTLLYFTFSNFTFIQCCIVFKYFPLINQHLLRRRINIRSLYNCDMIYCDCQQLDASWAQRKFSLSNCFFNRRGQQLEPSFR